MELEPTPILEPGPAGVWDAVDVLNPAAIRVGEGFALLYSGFDGEVWRTGLARSEDGWTWRKSRANPLLEPDSDSWEGAYMAANGALLRQKDEFLYWYQAGPRNATRIGLARSHDLERWRKEPSPVFGPGAPGTWDEAAVGDPYVIRSGEFLYLFYLGQNRFGVQRLGLARSREGVVWQRFHRNPLLEPGGAGAFDERGLGEPAVFCAGGAWRMLYVGRDASERRRLGWAETADGLDWRKTSEDVIAGEQPWNEAAVCDPDVSPAGDHLLLWFGGGSSPSPDENLAGRIGRGRIVSALGE